MKAFSQAPVLVKLVVSLLFIEALIIALVFFALLLELLSGNVLNIYAEIFLIVLAAGSIAWVLHFSRGILQGKRWARSAAFFWQLLQGVVGAGALAEQNSNRSIGVFLVVLSAVVAILLFNKRFIADTNRENDGSFS
jgi:O-antigen/teichoic acid export membrane protein